MTVLSMHERLAAEVIAVVRAAAGAEFCAELDAVNARTHEMLEGMTDSERADWILEAE